MKSITCPLCSTPVTGNTIAANNREYRTCSNCGLVFLGREFMLSESEEKERYEEHNNDPSDRRYIEHLSALTNELLPFLKPASPGSCGLDFGSGPGPAIKNIMSKEGFQMDNFDPFFNNDESLLNKKYDFITCTETIEHFHHPSREFNLLDSMLEREGFIGIMTNFLYEDIDFKEWWYPRDPTHVSFYTPETMRFIAKKFDWEIKFFKGNIIIYKKRT